MAIPQIACFWERDMNPRIMNERVSNIRLVLERLGAQQSINLTHTEWDSVGVWKQRVELSRLAREPGVLYCDLATLHGRG